MAGQGAVVTGAGRGLGREIARVLAQRGYAVHATDVDGEAAAATADELGGGAWSSALDVREESQCRAIAAATAARSGELAVWVNNAGILRPGPAWEQDEQTRRAMIEINALGTFNGTLAALEPMRAAGRGHVINVISLAGIVAAPGETVYAASKHAAIAFSLGTLFDLRGAGERGIDISCLCPDGIWTPMLHDKLDDPSAAASFSGTLLMPARVAAEVGKLLDKPRPVRVVPWHRALLLRTVDAFPRVGLAGIRPLLVQARAKQRRMKRRVEAGKWPPS